VLAGIIGSGGDGAEGVAEVDGPALSGGQIFSATFKDLAAELAIGASEMEGVIEEGIGRTSAGICDGELKGKCLADGNLFFEKAEVGADEFCTGLNTDQEEGIGVTVFDKGAGGSGSEFRERGVTGFFPRTKRGDDVSRVGFAKIVEMVGDGFADIFRGVRMETIKDRTGQIRMGKDEVELSAPRQERTTTFAG
jgi:hypothetical protein